MMKKDIKLIAFDIDGTIVNKDDRLLDATKDIIKDLKQRGKEIVLCTGRTFNGFYWIREELGLMDFDDYSITCTGAFVRQNATGKALIKKVLTKSDIENIYVKLDDKNIDFRIDTRDIFYCNSENLTEEFLSDQAVVRMPRLMYESLNDIDDYIGRACFVSDENTLNSFESRHKEDFCKSYRYMRNDRRITEILHKDAGKSETLLDLVNMLDLKLDQVMYFGDGVNDIKCLKAVGVGVAMGNAVEQTKQAADFVIGDNNSPAIAEFLKDYFND